MVHVFKYAFDSSEVSSVFTRAWKVSPGYFLFLLSIHTRNFLCVLSLMLAGLTNVPQQSISLPFELRKALKNRMKCTLAQTIVSVIKVSKTM